MNERCTLLAVHNGHSWWNPEGTFAPSDLHWCPGLTYTQWLPIRAALWPSAGTL